MELSHIEIEKICGQMRKYGSDGLEGCSRLALRQLEEYLVKKINSDLALQFRFREMNPQSPHLTVVGIFSNRQFLELVQSRLNQTEPQKSMQGEIPAIKTKSERIKDELHRYGFFELSKVKSLSEPNEQSLVELISTRHLPFSIAMLHYLDFLKHLKRQYLETDDKLYNLVATWFNVDPRAVKGNCLVLNEYSTENRKRYTADKQKENVQKEYEKLI